MSKSGSREAESNPEMLLTTDEAAARLGVERVTIYNYIKKGKLDAVKKGRDFLITNLAIGLFKKAKFTKTGGRPKQKKD